MPSDVNKVTTLTTADQAIYQSKLKRLFMSPNIANNKRIAAQKKNIILAAGRLEYEKGFDLLLESIRLIQDDLRHLNYELHLYMVMDRERPFKTIYRPISIKRYRTTLSCHTIP